MTTKRRLLGYCLYIRKNSKNFVNSPALWKKQNSKNIYFEILRLTSFLLIPLLILYDKNIDHQKFRFLEEDPFVYIVHIPVKLDGTKNSGIN